MEKIQSLREEQDNLRIVDYLDMQSLPQSLQRMLSIATTPEEKDILLMATLAAASACVPNLYFCYGPTGKRYYANLQCFILAASAGGKGSAGEALKMMRVIDAKHPLLIPGDSTLAAWYKTFALQGGCGYMHESEGSVITDIWRNSAANYNTALRKAAEHEPISRNRCKGASEIQSPRLSMLLTGTFNQYRALVPGVENGYFSRLLTLVISNSHPFSKRYVSARPHLSPIPEHVGLHLLQLYEHLLSAGEQEWSLTQAQKERLGEHLESEYKTLISMLGANFHSVVLRMSVQIERIAMILTALRLCEDNLPITIDQSPIFCSDQDYATAELIGNKLLLHMAAAYQLIEGDKHDLIPEIKPLDQRIVLFEQLKSEFALSDLISEAKLQGVSRRTAIRWNDSWQKNGLVKKLTHGKYQKIA